MPSLNECPKTIIIYITATPRGAYWNQSALAQSTERWDPACILQSKLVSKRKKSRGSSSSQDTRTPPCSQRSSCWDAPSVPKWQPKHFTILLPEFIATTRWMPPLHSFQDPSCREQSAGAVPTVTSGRKAPIRANTSKTKPIYIPGEFLSLERCWEECEEGQYEEAGVLLIKMFCSSSASAI